MSGIHRQIMDSPPQDASTVTCVSMPWRHYDLNINISTTQRICLMVSIIMLKCMSHDIMEKGRNKSFELSAFSTSSPCDGVLLFTFFIRHYLWEDWLASNKEADVLPTTRSLSQCLLNCCSTTIWIIWKIIYSSHRRVSMAAYDVIKMTCIVAYY